MWLNPFAPRAAPTPDAGPPKRRRGAPVDDATPTTSGAAPLSGATPLSRQLVLHRAPSRPRPQDDIEDSEDEEPQQHHQQPTAAPPRSASLRPPSVAPTPAAAARPRSSLASGLQLSASHLAEVSAVGGRGGSGRRAGTYGALVARAQADQETKVITARHGILRPSLASAEVVRSALSDATLQRLRLRLRRVLAPSPLVVIECDRTDDPGQTCHVMLRRDKFESVCRGGSGAFVVFPPWHEVAGGVILARNCEQDPTTAATMHVC